VTTPEFASNGNARVLSGEHLDTARAIISKYPNPRSAVLPLLFLVQSIEGYVTEGGMKEVAQLIDITPAQVLAAGSFYTMLKKKPSGTYLISVCRNVSCAHRGANRVLDAIRDRLQVEAGGATSDGTFEFETAECLATCEGAPTIQVNYEDFYNVTPESVTEIIDALERGDEVRSVRGEPVRTAKAISYENAVAGARLPGTAGDQSMRTVGGESPPEDMKPGERPKLDDSREPDVG
jgi:NADH-quinone oxidoreductase subunit E